MENQANPTQIMTQPVDDEVHDQEAPVILSDHDRRYQFTAPDDPPRYGLIAGVAGALIALILLTVMIANIADSTSGGEIDETLAAPDATQLEQKSTEQQSAERQPLEQEAFSRDEDGSVDEFGKSSDQDGIVDGTDDDDADNDDKDDLPTAAQATIPSLLGKPQSAVSDALGSLGISFSLVEKPSDTFTKGTVIGTSPEAGEAIVDGETISVFISSGPNQLVVPEVIGLEGPIAVARLTDAGLDSTLVEVGSETAEAGIVIASNPAVGTEVADGTVVELSVSTGTAGPTCVDVPNVIGQQAPIATGLLAQAGLIVTTKEVAHSATANTVVNTAPAAGQCVAPGSAATINVSCVSDIVPNVVGLPVEVLTVAGFTVEGTIEQTTAVPAGTVLSTTPAGGTRHCQSVPVAARVAETPNQPTCNVVVPNVIGQSARVAQAQLAAAGLTYSQTLAPAPAVPNGQIVSSQPSAGTAVCAGSGVSVVVSTGPAIVPDPSDCSIRVPPLALRPVREAEVALRQLGLVTVTVRQANDAVPNGFVIRWTTDRPVGNGNLCPGDRVFITVSSGPGR